MLDETPNETPKLATKPPANNGLHPGGRPALTLTPESTAIIIKCARMGMPKSRIAELLGISDDTLVDNKEFSDLYKNNYAEASRRVALKQFELLEGSNPFVSATMAIWLGKQHLGQSDKREEHVAIEQHQSVTFILPSGTRLRPGELAGEVVEGESRELPAASEDTPSDS